jgi:hypothetical protein
VFKWVDAFHAQLIQSNRIDRIFLPRKGDIRDILENGNGICDIHVLQRGMNEVSRRRPRRLAHAPVDGDDGAPRCAGNPRGFIRT